MKTFKEYLIEKYLMSESDEYNKPKSVFSNMVTALTSSQHLAAQKIRASEIKKAKEKEDVKKAAYAAKMAEYKKSLQGLGRVQMKVQKPPRPPQKITPEQSRKYYEKYREKISTRYQQNRENILAKMKAQRDAETPEEAEARKARKREEYALKILGMTDAEKAAKREEWRQRYRNNLVRKGAQTPEQRAASKAKSIAAKAEAKRAKAEAKAEAKRAKAEAKAEAKRAKAATKEKTKKVLLTPEERMQRTQDRVKSYREKNKEAIRAKAAAKIAAMTPEELAAHREDNRMRSVLFRKRNKERLKQERMTKTAAMTPEELAARNAIARENTRKRISQMSPEQLKKYRAERVAYNKRYRVNKNV